MRNPVSIGVFTSLILVGFASPSIAAPQRHSYVSQARQDAYCLQGRAFGYPGNCQFSTYEQCTDTASGTDAYCGLNPTYAFERQGGQWR